MSSIDRFLRRVFIAQNGHPESRLGQVFFNVLSADRPDIAAKVQGTDIDPFYLSNKEVMTAHPTWVAFTAFVMNHWEK